MTDLYIFGAPAKLGGAATKIRHLILLLKNSFRITVVLHHVSWLKDKEVTRFLNAEAVSFCLLKDLPPKVDGIALAICEVNFFTSGTAQEVKKRGLKLIFSNEMMWKFDGEAEAVAAGLIDKVLFVSEFQQENFKELYRNVPFSLVGNYIAPDDFEFVPRRNPVFTIGRLSRPDPDKYPEDFPVFYEELGFNDIRYRVMAWNDELRKKYSWHRFGLQWDLLSPQKEATDKFLQSLDLFVYPLGHRFKESWGRSTVEAMLTGCIPFVPRGHQFHTFIEHEESGFICGSFAEYKTYIDEVFRNNRLREQISIRCSNHARNSLCNPETHRNLWIDALLN